ncbi:MAG: type II secretion system protein M [Rhodocyclales bacterium]|nr:type II secretion system protein M [Rhodocyclales bacterium]
MSAVSDFMQRVRSQLELPRYRHLPKLLALAAVSCVVAVLSWLPGATERLAQRESRLGDALKAIQADISELERLKGRALPAKMAGAPLREAVAASLASQRSAMSVELVDAARVRVQGTGDFDSIVRWLGDVQRNHRLGVVALAIGRRDATVTVDLTLSASRE